MYNKAGHGFWGTIPAFLKAKFKTRRNANLYAALPRF